MCSYTGIKYLRDNPKLIGCSRTTKDYWKKKMSHRRIFIGDVHGHYDALMLLLKAISPSQDDQIYFLGDLIDRGPKSAQVVDFVMENNHKCLRGNHEEMLIDVFRQGSKSVHALHAWLYSGGQSTLASYDEDGVSQKHIDWISQLPLYLDLGDVWLVHAGVDPNISIEEQTAEEFCWIRDQFHRSNEPYFADKTIITGHTITFTLPGVQPGKLAQGNGWLDIDTGAYHPTSGWLTGLDWTNKLVYQIQTKDNQLRKIPLEEAVTKIKPSRIVPRHLMLK